MKKAIGRLVCFALALALCAAGALAEGQLTVTQENFYVIDNSSFYGYAYARIENTGDEPIKTNSGVLEIFGTDGETLVKKEYVNVYAPYLAPGEYTYASAYEKLDITSAEEVGNYRLTINTKNDTSKKTLRLTAIPSWEPDTPISRYSTSDYMVAVITNHTDRTVFDLALLLVLLDPSGNILYMNVEYMTNSKGLNPGSTMTVRMTVPNNRMKMYQEMGLTPSQVDVLAFATVDNN